jgi:Fasciclin domain
MKTSAEWTASGLVISALVTGCAAPKTPVTVVQTIAGRPEPSALNLDSALANAGACLIADDAAVQSADIVAANGVVHTVDHVLIPARPALTAKYNDSRRIL